MAIANGTRFGPYEIVGWLGAGGMGEVYRARDSRLARQVAIKLIPERLAADTARLDRFVRSVEARYAPAADFGAAIAHEHAISAALGGRTVLDAPRRPRSGARQLGLFEP